MLLLSAWLMLTATGMQAQETDSAGTGQPDTVYADKVPVSVENYDPYSSTATENDHDFDNIEDYNKERVQIRSIPDSFVKRLQNDPHFGYIKTGLKKKEQEHPAAPRNQQIRSTTNWTTVIPYIAIAIFVVILIWYLVNNNFILLKRKSVSVSASHYQDEHKDIFSIDYAAGIQKAVGQKNYRLAIRLQYLELLKNLSERKLIHFMPDKTNFEYLMQLRSSGYYDDFFSVTRNYEYSWYGLFDITEPAYQKINNAFQQFKQKLK
ncbi:hypothetical protein [Niabella ginsenosidivorans]|nr:hypothetical protein [Niabella ginsenosidivorans]